MIMVQLIAETIVSASRFNSRSALLVGVFPLQELCTTTSMARTSAARVKSTVLFLGREECQNIIPARALPKDARKVIVSFDNFLCDTLLMSDSRAFRPPRIMTLGLELDQGWGFTANHCEPIKSYTSFHSSHKSMHEFAFRTDGVFILRGFNFTLFQTFANVSRANRGYPRSCCGRIAEEVSNNKPFVKLDSIRLYGRKTLTNGDDDGFPTAVDNICDEDESIGDWRVEVNIIWIIP